jgi:hypothetical protein
MSDSECDEYSRPVGGRRPRGRKAMMGRGIGERDPMVHLAKGNLVQERAMEGMGSPAQQYRKLHKSAHAHMVGSGYTGGGFLSDLLGQVPMVGGPLSKITSAVGLGATGGRSHHARMARHQEQKEQSRMKESLGAEIEHLRRMGSGATGGMVYHGAVPHTTLAGGMRGGDFWSDFKQGFNSVIAPVAGVVKKIAPAFGPEGEIASKVIEAVGYGRRRRAKAGPSDGRRVRAELVRKVMKERGCSLPEASKIVKSEGLY